MPLTCRLDFPSSQEGNDQEAYYVEVPAEGLLRELAGKVMPAGRLTVACAVLDAGEHFGERAVFSVEDGFAIPISDEESSEKMAVRPRSSRC